MCESEDKDIRRGTKARKRKPILRIYIGYNMTAKIQIFYDPNWSCVSLCTQFPSHMASWTVATISLLSITVSYFAP